MASFADDSGLAPVNEISKKVNVIHLDGLTLLKIIKHCKESLPTLVAGSLLGLDNDRALEITHGFPFPSARDGEDADDAEGQEYQMEMMKMLREVNVDNNCVGWYQSTYLGAFCTASLIDTQFNYQENLGHNAVCLIFDPLKSSKGILSLHAYRLTNSFMEAYRKKEFTRESLGKLEIKSGNILEEIPIKIKNSHLATALLYEFASDEHTNVDFDRLDLSTDPYLEKNVEFVMSWVDDLLNEMNRFQYFERNLAKQKQMYQQWLVKRREENKIRASLGQETLPEEDPVLFKPIPEPSRLESLLMSHQINSYCNQINKFCGGSFEKLFFAGSLQKE